MKYFIKQDFMLTRIVSLISFLLVYSFSVFTQNNQIDVRNVTTDKFPEVKGEFWVRTPEEIDKKSVKFYENNQLIKANFETVQKVETVSRNKMLLFLIRNTASKLEKKWYKEVLSNAFKNGAIKSGDRIEIVGFSCFIDKQILYPSTFNFTDNIEVLLSRVDEITESKRLEYNQGKVQTHIAINEALNALESLNLELPTGIFVLSDDCSMPPILTGELPGPRSLRLNIPIYGISYFKSKTYFDLKELCTQTYGLYATDTSNDISSVSKEFNTFISDFENRHAGIYYPFSYTSTFEKDGKNHLVKIESKEGQAGFSLAVPSKNILELIQDNLLIVAVIFILLIVFVVMIVMMNKKNNLKKEELELERKKQFSEMEQSQRVSENKLTQQEMELHKIKEDERREMEVVKLEKQQKAQANEDEVQLQKMLERGNFPWFEFHFGTERGNYQIQTPRLTSGRDTSNTWMINHPTVSRNHFTLTFNNYVYTIRDNGSSNGIIVNNCMVAECELKHGDCIQVGEITLTFHI